MIDVMFDNSELYAQVKVTGLLSAAMIALILEFKTYMRRL